MACILILAPAGALAQSPRDALFEVEVSRRTRRLLTEALQSSDVSWRSQAVAALRLAATEDTASAVIPLLEDDSPSVRSEALWTLEAILPPARLAPLLLRTCSDSSQQVVRHALIALGRLPGRDGFSALLQAKDRIPATLRAAWVEELANREEQVPALLVQEWIADRDPEVRSSAAGILARFPTLVPKAMRLGLLVDEDPLVRVRAVESLDPETEDLEVRTALLRALDDPAPWVRRAALGQLTARPPAQETLSKLLGDPDPTVRLAAARVAEKIGGIEMIRALIERLADDEVLVAEAAAVHLANINSSDAQAALIRSLNDPREQVVALAVRGLGFSRRSGIVPVLRPMVEHSSSWVRTNTYEAFGHAGDTSVVPLLLDHAGQESAVPRAALNQTLGQLRDPRAITHLLVDINYPDKRSKGLVSVLAGATIPPPYPLHQTAVANAAIRALGKIGDPAVVAALLEVCLDTARDSSYFDSMAWSLGALGDTRAAEVLEMFAVEGAIIYGQYVYQMSDSSRIEALRAIESLDLKDMIPEILEIDPIRCSLPVRQTAAEVLSRLTGKRYVASRPIRIGHFVLEANDDPADINAPRRPIVFLAEKE